MKFFANVGISQSVLQCYHYRTYATYAAILFTPDVACSPAVAVLTVQLHYAVIPAGMTVKDSGKTRGYPGGTKGLEKQNCLQLEVPMIS